MNFCPNKFYEVEGINKCEDCDGSCLTCNGGSEYNCLSCNIGSYLDHNY